MKTYKHIKGTLNIIFLMFMFLGAKEYDLVETFDIAIFYNSDLKIAKYYKQVANEDYDKAFSVFYPQISVSASWMEVNEFPVIVDSEARDNRTKKRDYTLDVSLDVLNIPSWYGIDLAKNSYNQQVIEEKLARKIFMLELISLYFKLISSYNNIDILEERLSSYALYIKKAKLELKNGLISKSSFFDILSKQNLLTSTLLKTRLDTSKLKDSFSTLTNVDPTNIKKQVYEHKFNYIKNISMGNNFDVLLAKSKILEAKYNKNKALSANSPRVFLNYKKIQNDIPGIDDEYKIAMNFELSIFSGFEDKNKFQSLQVLEFIEREKLIKTKKEVYSKIKSLTSQVDYLKDIIKHYKNDIKSKKFLLDATDKGYQKGYKHIIDLLEAKNNYYDSIQKLEDYKSEYIVAISTLMSNLGQLNFAFIERLNGYLYE